MKVLDHGYVNLVETWGSDERIIEAARMSTAKGFKGWGPTPCPVLYERNHGGSCAKCAGTGEVSGDERFLRFLWEHKHLSPFEQAGMTVEVQAPIFVFREWHRHRTQSYNEMSGRYTVLPDLMYVPSLDRLRGAKQSLSNKQSSADGLAEMKVLQAQELIEEAQLQARDAYSALLSLGVAREVARIVLPVAQYSRMRASANLRNWLGFLTLRMAPDAQWEIRQYANVVGEFVKQTFPRTWEIYRDASS